MPQEEPKQFTRTLIKTDGRFLVESACERCGMSKLVSYYDGSADAWESEHDCAKCVSISD